MRVAVLAVLLLHPALRAGDESDRAALLAEARAVLARAEVSCEQAERILGVASSCAEPAPADAVALCEALLARDTFTGGTGELSPESPEGLHLLFESSPRSIRVRARIARAEALARLGRCDEAVRSLESFLACDASLGARGRAGLALAWIHVGCGDRARARTVFESLLEGESRSLAEASAPSLWMHLGEWQRALEGWERSPEHVFCGTCDQVPSPFRRRMIERCRELAASARSRDD